MSTHPLNLALRFLLELAAWTSMGYWGWTRASGWLRPVLAAIVALLAIAAWGTFAVPDDPSRSGKAPVPVPGVVRLALELAEFAFAAWALTNAGSLGLGIALGATVIAHYALSYDRIAWLLRQ